MKNRLSPEATQIMGYVKESTHLFDRVLRKDKESLTDNGLYKKVMESMPAYLDIKTLRENSQ